MKNFSIEDHVTACDVSYRGGIIKVDVSSLFPEVEEWGEDAIMGASQNYLGGGIAGRITSGAMFDKERLSKDQQVVYEELADEIKKYFYDLNNGGGDEYMQEEGNGGFEENQRRAVSGY